MMNWKPKEVLRFFQGLWLGFISAYLLISFLLVTQWL
jgi:hypothetical protein